jgi:hypothetical protein
MNVYVLSKEEQKSFIFRSVLLSGGTETTCCFEVSHTLGGTGEGRVQGRGKWRGWLIPRSR